MKVIMYYMAILSFIGLPILAMMGMTFKEAFDLWKFSCKEYELFGIKGK